MKHKSRTREAGHLTVVSARVEVQWTEIRRPQLRIRGWAEAEASRVRQGRVTHKVHHGLQGAGYRGESLPRP